MRKRSFRGEGASVRTHRAIRATAALRVEKTRKNRWSVETRVAATIRLRYRVYARTMAPQGNW
ncbi:MAG: hypothetical protein ACSLFQ_13660, partial [Thermoanaerobaculia bacterium]